MVNCKIATPGGASSGKTSLLSALLRELRLLGGEREVEAGDPELLASLVTRVKRAVAEAGPGVSLNDKFGFIPHVTLAKVSRPVARMRRSKYIDSSYYESHCSNTFGSQNIDNLQLCVIDSSTRYDGFYSTLADFHF